MQTSNGANLHSEEIKTAEQNLGEMPLTTKGKIMKIYRDFESIKVPKAFKDRQDAFAYKLGWVDIENDYHERCIDTWTPSQQFAYTCGGIDSIEGDNHHADNH